MINALISSLFTSGFIVGLFVALGSYLIFKAYVIGVGFYRFNKNYNNFPRAAKHNNKDLCQGPHEWETAELALRNVEPGEQFICKKCGLIQNTDYKLNESGLEVLLETLKLRQALEEETKRIKERFDEQVEKEVAFWISKNLGYFMQKHDTIREDTDFRIQLLKDFAKFVGKVRHDVNVKMQAEKNWQVEQEEKLKKLGY